MSSRTSLSGLAIFERMQTLHHEHVLACIRHQLEEATVGILDAHVIQTWEYFGKEHYCASIGDSMGYALQRARARGTS